MLRAGVSVGMVPNKVGGVMLTPEQQNRYQAQSGSKAHAALQALIASPQWKGLDSEGKQEAAAKAIRDARAAVRATMFGSTKGAPRKSDPWSAFPDAKDEWSGFDDPPQDDIVGSLTSSIPGLTVGNLTSGFRTPEYQAELKRRGYHPADNSGHLDGSSLDITVPRGRSLGWLTQQVKRAQPNARLLPEGDHLHASFPVWYGAPVLGGAVKAGLRNPMAKP
jgi:hypothetical protein